MNKNSCDLEIETIFGISKLSNYINNFEKSGTEQQNFASRTEISML